MSKFIIVPQVDFVYTNLLKQSTITKIASHPCNSRRFVMKFIEIRTLLWATWNGQWPLTNLLAYGTTSNWLDKSRKF